MESESPPMCSGRNPLNKNLSGFISAFPDRTGAFSCPSSWCETQKHTMTTALIDRPILAIRNTGNRDHHIWNNNGTWWCHYTEHLPDYTKRRVRKSLHTDNIGIARVLRDSLLCEADQ